MNKEKKRILMTLMCAAVLSTQLHQNVLATDENQVMEDVEIDNDASYTELQDENSLDSSLVNNNNEMSAESEAEALLIPDAVFRNVLRNHLGLGANEYLTAVNLATITELRYDGASNSNNKINSIEGIGNLVNIRNLYLPNHNIKNLNNEIQNLMFLDILDFTGNQLNDDDFIKMIDSKALRLTLNNNQLTNVSMTALNNSARAKKDIIHLGLEGNQFTAVELSDFESIISLNLSFNSKIEEITLENMAILSTLSLTDNSLLHSAQIRNMPLLTSLTLTNNKALENLTIENLQVLSTLLFTGNISLKNLALANMPLIYELNLNGTKVTAFNAPTLTNLITLYTSNITEGEIDLSNWPIKLQTVTANNVTFQAGSAAILSEFENLNSLSIHNSAGINDIGSYIKDKFIKLRTLNADSLVNIKTEESNKILEAVFASAKSRNKKWSISLKSNKITRFKKYIIESGLVTSSMGVDDRTNFMTKVILDGNHIFEPSIARGNWLTGLGDGSTMNNQSFIADTQVLNYSKDKNYTIPIFKNVNRLIKDNYPADGLIVGDKYIGNISGTIRARKISGVSNISKINETVSQNLKFVIQDDKVKEVKVSFFADVPQKVNTGGLDQSQYSATVTIPLKFKPTLSNLTTVSVNINDTTFDPNIGIEAWDDEGELTSQITSNWNPENLKKAGTYTVTYSVTDSEGLTQTGTRKIVVVDPNIVYAHIPDNNLKKALNTLLNKPLDDADIAVSDLETLTGNLNLSGKGIKDLSGLEHAVNITTLNLSNNSDLVDIDAVASLSKLNTLYLANNTSLTSIDGIKDITTLKTISLVGTNLDDYAVIRGLQNLSLTSFNIKDTTNIKDLGTLKDVFTQLTTLIMDNSSIENIDFLREAKLTTLNVVNNESLLNLDGAANIETLKTINITGSASLEGFGDSWLSTQNTVLETIVIDTMGSKMNLDSVAGLTTLKNLTVKNRGAATRLTNNGVKITAPLTNLTLEFTNIENIDSLSENTTLINVSLFNNQELNNIDGLVSLPSMKNLTIYGNPKLIRIGSVNQRNFSGLQNLYFYVDGLGSSPKLTSIEGLKNTGMTSLTNLYLQGAGLTDLSGLEDLESVITLLDLSHMPNLETMLGLNNLERVNTLNASSSNRLSDILNLNQLKSAQTLNFSNTRSLKSFEGLSKLTHIPVLNASNATGLVNTSGLDNLLEAGTLNFQGATALQNFIGLENLEKVTTLNASGATKLVNTTGLNKLKEAGTLNFEGDTALRTFVGLTSLEKVTTLNASKATALTSTVGLNSLTSAGTLNFQGATSLQSFAGLSNLRSVSDTFQFDNIGNTKYINIDALTSLNSVGTLINSNTSINDYSNFSHFNITSSYTADNAKITDSDLEKIMQMQFTNAELSLRNNEITDISYLKNINGTLRGVVRFANNKITSLPNLANLSSGVISNVTEFTFGNNRIMTLEDFTSSIPANIKITALSQTIQDGEMGVVNGNDVKIHNKHLVKSNQYATISNVSPQGFFTPSDNTVTWKSPSLNVTLSYHFNYSDSLINFGGSYSAKAVQNTPPTIIAETLQVHRHQAWNPKSGVVIVDVDQPDEGEQILEDTFTLISSDVPLVEKEYDGKIIQVIDPDATPGEYSYEFEVTDSASATVTAKRSVTILSDDAPTLEAPDIVVLEGDDTFHVLNGVSATIESYISDPYTPTVVDLSQDDISYTSNNFDIHVPGDYEVEVTATNSTVSPSVSTSVIRKITVRKNIPPILKVPENITLKVNEVGNFDPLAGVTFSDDIDSIAQLNSTKELIGTIQRPAAGMDEKDDGVYELEYRIKDSDGNVVSAKRIVTVTNRIPYIIGANTRIVLRDGKFTQAELDAALKDGVTASDLEDGDLTLSLNIPSVQLNNLKIGDNEVEYSVTDSDSNTSIVKRIIHVETNTPPVLTVNPKEVELSLGQLDSLDIMDGVSAFDTEDNLDGFDVSIKTDLTKADIKRPGANKKESTTINYMAEDRDGNTVQDSRIYTVTNYAPTITLKETYLTIRQNKLTDDEFSKILMENVSADDYEDGDITNQINIENSDLKTFIIGENKVKYTVSDADGNMVEEIMTVLMESNEAPVLSFSSPGLGNRVELNAGEINEYNMRLKEGIAISDDHDNLTIDDIQVNAKLMKGLPSDEKIIQKISYTITDSDGNTSLPIVREYIISDEKPKFDNASIELVKTDIQFVEGFYNGSLTEGIHYTDKESPDSVILSVTVEDKMTNIIYDGNNISNNEINKWNHGNYLISYIIKDSDGNLNTLTRNMIINENIAPSLEIGDSLASISISSKNNFHPLDNIKIIDRNDSDTKLTYNEEYREPQPGKSSIYKIIYTLENKYGATNTIVRSIEVTNMIPVIEFSNQTITIKQGDSLDFLSGVFANDQEDGDITDKISYSPIHIESLSVGNYEITYSVEDSDGNKTSAIRVLRIVNDINSKEMPVQSHIDSENRILSNSQDSIATGDFHETSKPSISYKDNLKEDAQANQITKTVTNETGHSLMISIFSIICFSGFGGFILLFFKRRKKDEAK